MLKFSINKFLELRLEQGKTNMYVSNKLFIQCKHLLLNIPVEEIENLKDFKSIDETIEKLDGSYEFSNNNKMKITPEIEFWGHCSNLQVWYENCYDPCILHSNLAFPLLKKLTDAGDKVAKIKFKEEIARKFEKGNLSNIQYLLDNNYLDYLNAIELESILSQSRLEIVKKMINRLEKLLHSRLTNFKLIRELLDLIIDIDLRYNVTLLREMIERFPQKKREQFIKALLLHLNYKEFNNYTIPYGRFFIYIENLITYVYENYPRFKDLLTVIEYGYYYSAYSLEDGYTYGTVLYK